MNIDEAATILNEKKEVLFNGVQTLLKANLVNIAYPEMALETANKAIAQIIKLNLDAETLKGISQKIGLWLESKEPESYAELTEYFSEAAIAEKIQYYAEGAARFFEKRFNTSEALKYYEKALLFTIDKNKQKNLLRSASRMNILIGNYKDAAVRLNKLISLGDETLEDYSLLGMAYTKMRDYKSARQTFENGAKKAKSAADIAQFKNSLGNNCFYSGRL